MWHTKRSIFMLFLILPVLLFISNTSFAQGEWHNSYTVGSPTDRQGQIEETVDSGNKVIFGGKDSYGNYLNDLYEFNFPNWTKIEPVNEPPSPRWNCASSCFDNKLYIFGGEDENGYLDDIWIFDFETKEWSPLSNPEEKPSARSNSVAVEYNDDFYLTGGNDTENDFVDTWRYDPETHTWTRLQDSPNSVKKSAHGSYADKFFTVQTNGVYEYNYLTNTWSIKPTSGTSPTYRENTANVQVGSTVYTFGGNEPGSTESSAATSIWNLSNNHFSEGAEMPTPASNGIAIPYRDSNGKMQIFYVGGKNNNGDLNGEIGVYDPPPYMNPNGTYQPLANNQTEDLNGIAVVENGDQEQIVTVGNSGTVSTSPDKGASFFAPAGVDVAVFDIKAIAPFDNYGTTAYIAAGDNHVYFFDGNTPNPRDLGVEEPNSHQSRNYQALAHNDDKIVAVGNSGNQAVISQWTYYQGSWEYASVNPYYQYDNLSSCFITPDGKWHVGGEGSYYQYNQNGQSQGYQDISNMNSVNGIFFITGDIGFMIGNNGTFNTTTDGGATWQTGNVSSSLSKSTNQQRLTNEDLNAITFYDENYGVIVGNSGTILATNDGGQSWAAQTSGTTNDLTDVCITNSGIVYITGKGGIILTNKNMTNYAFSVSLSPDNAASAECSVSVTPTLDTYKEGTFVSLKANPGEGWDFVKWGGDISGTSDSLDFTLNSSKIVIGEFKDATTDLSDPTELPRQFSLSQNYPNPFNPSTFIEYQLPERSEVQLNIYNVLGEKIAELINGEIKDAGKYKLYFNAANLPSGVYFYVISTENYYESRKMILLK